jgi:hypothetical protein
MSPDDFAFGRHVEEPAEPPLANQRVAFRQRCAFDSLGLKKRVTRSSWNLQTIVFAVASKASMGPLPHGK